MGKHSMGDPLTVEELAAQERAERRRRLTSPAVVGTAAAAVLAMGAAAWAFSLPDRTGQVLSPGPDTVPTATASAGEGFGQVVPTSPASSPAPSPTRASRSPAASQPPSPPGPPATAALSAAYIMSTWPDAYKLEFAVTNRSTDPALWTVRLEVPTGARLDQLWNAEIAQESATVWLLRPPRWDGGNPRPIPPGGRFEFGLIVQGGQTVVSCTLDGSPCTRAN